MCLGDGHTVQALGKRNIQLTMVFKMNMPKEVVMYNTLYVPNLTSSLFFVTAAG